jgi:hypothetical protein
MKQLRHQLIVITLFAIAMALLESAVVIYMREILYPGGFEFPLAPVLPHLLLTEILREVATIVMLATIGILAARTFSRRFAWFVYAFAIWDIFYYVFLWLLLGWPESLLTWDVLFLIPATWTGPVITPLILTMLMILLAGATLYHGEKGRNTKLLTAEWGGLILGSAIAIVAFMTDYMRHMREAFSFGDMLRADHDLLLSHAESYIPDRFPWLLFAAGAAVIATTITLYARRLKLIR